MAYKVSIPLCLLTPPELVVSFPVTSSYQEGPVQSLSHLQARLAQVPDVLPPEWINLTQSHPISDKVVLAKFSLHALLGAPAFVITIDERLTWTLSCLVIQWRSKNVDCCSLLLTSSHVCRTLSLSCVPSMIADCVLAM